MTLLLGSSQAPSLPIFTYQDGLSNTMTTWGNISNAAGAVNKIASNGTISVAIGYGGRAATSTDGITWIYQPGLSTIWPKTSAPTGIVWGAGLFIVYGISGIIVTSPDGITWSSGSLGTTWSSKAVNCIAWNGSMFVAVGASNAFAYSTNGITWTYKSGLATMLFVIWSGARFVAVGANGKFETSTNGITWTDQLQPGRDLGWSTKTPAAIITNPSTKNVYVFSTAGDIVYTSNNVYADFWYSSTGLSSTAWGANTVNDVVWNGSKFVVVGPSTKIATSTNGTTWTYQTGLSTIFNKSGTLVGVLSITWNGSVFIVGGASHGIIATSPDGITWTYQDDLSKSLSSWDTASSPTKIIWNGSNFLVGGQNTKLATSINGVSWSYQPGLTYVWGNTTSISGMAWNGSVFVVCGLNGKLATSPDGITWTNQTSSLTGIRGIIWNKNISKFIIYGIAANVATSPDGITWTNQTGLSTLWATGANSILSIVWNGNKYVAFGQNCRSATSPDGITWTNQTGLSTLWTTSATVASVSWDGSKFFARGYIGSVNYTATSPDGITWTNQTLASDIGTIMWDGARYVAVGTDVRTSTDGIVWSTKITSLSSTNWGTVTVSDIAFNGSKYVVVGANGRAATIENL